MSTTTLYTIPDGDNSTVVLSHAIITGSGPHNMTFLGSDDQITMGAGNDTICVHGSNNVIDAGNGFNIVDSTGNNTYILPAVSAIGQDSILQDIFRSGSKVDLRPALAVAGYDGNVNHIDQYLKVAGNAAGDMVVQVATPTGFGTFFAPIAYLENGGDHTLKDLIGKSII